VLGLLLPTIQGGVLFCVTQVLLDSAVLAVVVTLTYLGLWWRRVPGKNFRSKVDHYLRLNGRWIAGLTCPLKPDREFIKLRQSGLVFLGFGLVMMFWLSNSDEASEDVLSSKVSELVVKDAINFDLKRSNHHDVLLGELNQNLISQMQMGLNLRDSTMSVKIQTRGEGSELYFFEDHWVSKLPFEWEK